MKHTIMQEIDEQTFRDFLREKGIISEDSNITFIIDRKYSDFHNGTPYVSKIRITKEIEVEDMLL